MSKEIKERIWNALSPKEQKKQEKKAQKSLIVLTEKARIKGALVNE